MSAELNNKLTEQRRSIFDIFLKDEKSCVCFKASKLNTHHTRGINLKLSER